MAMDRRCHGRRTVRRRPCGAAGERLRGRARRGAPRHRRPRRASSQGVGTLRRRCRRPGPSCEWLRGQGAGSTHAHGPVGLSSSAALEVAVALAIGADDSDPVALARLCQAARARRLGARRPGSSTRSRSICGVAGNALLLDCHTVTVTPVRLPPADVAEWVVLACATGGRDLATSGYSEARRRARPCRGRDRAATTRRPR